VRHFHPIRVLGLAKSRLPLQRLNLANGTTRRALLSLALFAFAPAMAQARTFRVGMLSPGPASISAFRQWALPELAKRGFVEGHNLMLEGRSSEGRAESLPALAHEIAAFKPDVLVAVSNPVAHILRAIVPSVPIVMGFAGTDPVADGLISSLSHTNSRVTGIVMMAQELDTKRFEFATQLMPTARRIGYLVGSTGSEARISALESIARGLGIALVVGRSHGVGGYEAAFAELSAARVEAVVVASFPGFSSNAELLALAALNARIPAFCEWRHMAEAGCLVSYGAVLSELQRRVGLYVARILQGELPSDMPMEQATRFELLINLKTAKALGVKMPALLTARADELIE
jgi:putative ABC transport system substrate-binding protein